MAFDRAAYRYWVINWKEPEKARENLKKAIDESLLNKVENPVTNYYGVPLVEVSPAFGIALGYCELTTSFPATHDETHYLVTEIR